MNPSGITGGCATTSTRVRTACVRRETGRALGDEARFDDLIERRTTRPGSAEERRRSGDRRRDPSPAASCPRWVRRTSTSRRRITARRTQSGWPTWRRSGVCCWDMGAHETRVAPALVLSGCSSTNVARHDLARVAALIECVAVCVVFWLITREAK